MDDLRWSQLDALLRRLGTASAADIAQELGVSQPTVSRLLAQAGDRVVRVGRARAARYARAREIARAGNQWPLYRIDAKGRPEQLGALRALQADQFLFASDAPRPALQHGEFRDGLFPGLPWFLDDQRPQGFLGRAFGRRVAVEIGTTPEILLWSADDIVLALLRHGEDAPGDLVLGEDSLQRALHAAVAPRDGVRIGDREREYPRWAERALRGDIAGSSAGGEQPKFTLDLLRGEEVRSVIVKFSDRTDNAGARRWADLLVCEHLAGTVLSSHGLAAAESELVEAEGRVFLQSIRFDRSPARGRCGFVSLAALDAAYYGEGRIDWWRLAPRLARDGWIDEADARRLRLYSWFGALIANSDMHLGNAALRLQDARPLPLQPAYDMLPMYFRPAATGEVIERDYLIALPNPEQRDDWREAAQLARTFWESVADDRRVSAGMRAPADAARSALDRALARS